MLKGKPEMRKIHTLAIRYSLGSAHAADPVVTRKKVLGVVIPLRGPQSIIGNPPLQTLFNIGVTYSTRSLRA